MTKEARDKELELVLAENRAAIERFDAFHRRMAPLIAAHLVTSDRLLKRLREATRRR